MGGDTFDMDACLRRVREGDQEAASVLVAHLYPMVIRIVRSHQPIRQSDEDLTQEIFLKMFNKLDRYRARPGIPFTHWVSRLSVRTCLDALRAERRRPELRWSDFSEDETVWLEYLVADQAEAPPEGDLGAREVIEKLFSELEAKDRLVLTMTDLEQRSVAEVSRLTGWSRASVKVRTFRARQRLRRLATRLRRELFS